MRFPAAAGIVYVPDPRPVVASIVEFNDPLPPVSSPDGVPLVFISAYPAERVPDEFVNVPAMAVRKKPVDSAVHPSTPNA